MFIIKLRHKKVKVIVEAHGDFIETLNNQDLGLTLEYCQDLQAKRINDIRKAS